MEDGRTRVELRLEADLLVPKWRHIDLDRKTLIVENAKGYRSRIVPLCFQAVTLLMTLESRYECKDEDDRLLPSRSIREGFKTAAIEQGSATS